MNQAPHVAIVGATGAVGVEILSCLETRNFPVGSLKLLASARSAGKQVAFRGKMLTVEELTEKSFDGVDIALFSAGGGISLKFAPIAAAAGCVVIDNSSAFRQEPDVPLVVPEINPEAAFNHPRNIIANPNCTTIITLMALFPLHQRFGLKTVIASSYQAVSGSGQHGIAELETQVRAVVDGHPVVKNVYPHQIAFNLLPQIDSFTENGKGCAGPDGTRLCRRGSEHGLPRSHRMPEKCGRRHAAVPEGHGRGPGSASGRIAPRSLHRQMPPGIRNAGRV